MLADLHAVDRSVDRVVVRARLLCLRVTLLFRIPRVDVAGASAQPDHHAVIDFPLRKVDCVNVFRFGGGKFARSKSRSGGRTSNLQKVTTRCVRLIKTEHGSSSVGRGTEFRGSEYRTQTIAGNRSRFQTSGFPARQRSCLGDIAWLKFRATAVNVDYLAVKRSVCRDADPEIEQRTLPIEPDIGDAL